MYPQFLCVDRYRIDRLRIDFVRHDALTRLEPPPILSAADTSKGQRPNGVTLPRPITEAHYLADAARDD